MISCCWRCIFCIEWNCLTVSGSRIARIRIVSAMIEKPQENPTWLWKNRRIDWKTSISGGKMFAGTNMLGRSGPGLEQPLVPDGIKSAVTERVTSEQPPAGQD